LTLPKGGGAIRGIGEKFTANPATGAGTMTVPIFASPGRSGFGPQLSLSYNSGSGNSPFGFGWSVSLPMVTRKTDKGLPQYQDAQESDVFILSAAEELMPALVESGGDWTRDVIASRSLYGSQYAIHRYRPRVDSLFARIERWINRSNSGDTFWRTITKENVTTWYGKTAASRIADPADPTRIFTWLICESYDDKGNAVSYEYKPEDSVGVNLSQVCERNRTDATRSANQYIKRIFYGNSTPYFPNLALAAPVALPTDWCFELVFDYGDQDLLNPVPQDTGIPWNCRLDPFSTYRSTFEVRTYRLCRRVLMFHSFTEDANVGLDCLAASTDLMHTAAAPPADPSQPFYSYLLAVTRSGYTRNGAAGYVTDSMPPLEFQYTQAIVDETVRQVDPESLMNLPYGLDGRDYRWADLDGEGLSGILTEQAGSWFYKANLSPVNQQTLAGKQLTLPTFAPVERVANLPSTAALNQGQQVLLSVSGDGQLDLVNFQGPAPGYFERTDDADWESFIPFQSLPVVDWQNPELKFIDLTGDGFPDLLINEGGAFSWYRSLSTEGFAGAQRIPQFFDEEQGPKLVFSDSTQSIFLADISGDGLTDLVRIRNGQICYWPNEGYGKFGAKVTMDSAPLFDRPDIFDGRRIRLADIDGSGTADIIYFAANSVQLYFNQSGNGWGSARALNYFPAVNSTSPAMVIDLLGNGTACLVWSSSLPGNASAPMCYIDLMGGQKPHLLVQATNNLGAQTVVCYAPSTKFYVVDKLAGTPWVTRLPFPVQVVERLETFDYISRNVFVSCYAYHNGYYDGVEREFRGFGRVDQWDTEEYATLINSGSMPAPANVSSASDVPPMLTKTWFHTGAFFGEAAVSTYMQAEYYSEGDAAEAIDTLTTAQFDAMLLDDTVLPTAILLPDGSRLAYPFSPEELREACRALRGSMLRREIYALDGTPAADRPYIVSESNYTIEAFQPQGPNQYGSFFAHARESLDFNYERQLYQVVGDTIIASGAPPTAVYAADPRVVHTLTLDVDQYGNVLQSATVAYGRRYLDPSLSAADQATQSRLLSICAQNTYTNAIDMDDVHRTPLAAESITCELIQAQPAASLPDITNLFGFDEMTATLQGLTNGLHDLPFEDLNPVGLTPGQAYRRPIADTRTYYRPDDMGAAAGNPRALLALGVIESLALPGCTCKLAFTPGLIAQVYQRNGTALLPTPATVLGSVAADGGGYVDLDGDGQWWIPGGRSYYLPTAPATPQELTEARQNFFLPRRFEDPFGNASSVNYDGSDLLAIQATDAVNNVVSAVNDYRVLRPVLITDANLNQSAASFDLLGMLTATAVMGKSGQNLGDTLKGFTVDLPQSQIDAFHDAADQATLNALAAPLLGNATMRIIYDIHGFANSQAAAPNDPTQWQPAFAATIARETHVSDLGPGQQSAMQVSFVYSDGFGRTIQTKLEAEPGPVVEGGPAVASRWVGSGWTIYNNKGKPVRKFEPFFSQLAQSAQQFEFGVQVGVSPVLCYDPPGRVVATLYPNQTYEKVVFDPWHQVSWDVNDTVLVTNPAADADAGDFFLRLPIADYSPTWYTQRATGGLGAQEQAAAAKAAVHANTPATAYFDPLGRTFLSVANNGTFGNLLTRVALDIQNNKRSETDPRSRQATAYDYNLLGGKIHQASMEAGARWMLNDVLGKPIRGWDSRGHNTRTAHDALQRPLSLYVLGTDPVNSDPRTLAGEVLCETFTYGEGQTNDQGLNLRTRIYQHNDSTGVVMNMVTVPATQQQVAYDFKGNSLGRSRQYVLDQTSLPDWSKPAPAFMADVFVSLTQYDALNRTIAATAPDGSVVSPTYNESNLLQSINTTLPGAAAATSIVTSIQYNAKGQRVLIDYGNNVETSYAYDPLTFRLINLTTTRTGFPTNQQTVQDLSYTCDPAANITHIDDEADIQDVVFFRNQRVDPSADYTYDPVYQLILSSGREQLGLNGSTPLAPAPSSYNDVPRVGLLSPSDGNAMGTYTEQYQYDPAGNLAALIHKGSDPANPGWSRAYTYNEPSLLVAAQVSNRLSSTAISGNMPLNEPYGYDLQGNMASMPQLSAMQWDFKDMLLMTQRQAVNAGDQPGIANQGMQTWYDYNSAGERMRKTTVSPANVKLQERFYLGGYEVYREYDSTGKITLECHTLHVMDGSRRVVLIETTTTDTSATAGTLPTSLTRYQYDNHLGTASLELDPTGAVITYEEYYPFGSTSYQAGASLTEVNQKRYRYIGKERDEETGLNYHGARYYALWLGRWTSCDPTGSSDGLNLYAYVRNNPVRLRDRAGTDGRQADESCTDHGHSNVVAPSPPAVAPAPPASAQPTQPTQPAPAAQPAAQDAGTPSTEEQDDTPAPTNVYTSATASSATARTLETEATGTVVAGGNGSGVSAAGSAQVAVRIPFKPVTKASDPLVYGWDAGFVLGGSHGFTDSSRSPTFGATLRYGRGTDPGGPRVSLGVALALTYNPTYLGTVQTGSPLTFGATGVLEIAASKAVTIDVNLVGSGSLFGGSTAFTGVGLDDTATVGGQAQVQYSFGHANRWTLGPEGAYYRTFGSGAPASPGAPDPSIDSTKYLFGVGLSRKLGPPGVPTSVVGFQLDGAYEITHSQDGQTSTTTRGGGAVFSFGGTY
jgi:RHS repeat-associated protein